MSASPIATLGVESAEGPGARPALAALPQPSRRVLEACRHGDPDAFAWLFHRYRDHVYRLALHVCGNPSDAGDVTQEVFLKLLTRIRQYREDARFTTWLYRVALNAAFDHHRARRPLLSLDELPPATSPGVAPQHKGSPLLVGVGENEWFVASDASPLLQYTRSVVYLDDGEMVVLSREGYRVRNLETTRISKPVNQIEWDLAMVERNGYAHFMLKEICEQPESLCNTLRGHLLEEEGTARVTGLNLSDDQLKQVERIVITACGTSWHSGLIGEYMLEEMARIPVEVEYASEFRYRNPVVDHRTLVIGISQSGETADTLAAIREAKRRGARTVGLVNVVGSTIAREVDGGIYLHAGPEVGVASTKAFTSQVAALALVTLRIARLRNLSILQGREFIQGLRLLPGQIAQILERSAELEQLAERFLGTATNALYLGRGVNFPVALEGALKLKEIAAVAATHP
jgi:glucosamine--fructose-6-phosphate aminotransferase (isomerizing)